MLLLSASNSVLILMCYYSLVRAQSSSDKDQVVHDEGRLHTDLFQHYHADFRPVKDHKSAVNVKIRLALKYISFDSQEEVITVHSWIAMSWKDELLNWKPSDYGDITETQVESHEIWSPRMALYNADARLYTPDSLYTTCTLSNEGVVTCVPQIAHSGICRTMLRRWPYDVQNCSLYFGSWMHTGEQINFTFFKNNPVVKDDYQNGPGWKLITVVNERFSVSYSCCPNSTYPMLKYIFMLKREAAGPAAIVVIPSIVIVLLTLTSLLLDIKDNTRLALTCFSLFGHFLFLTQISAEIPKHSSDTPILLLFVRDSMIVTLTAILETLLLMAIRRKVVSAPRWIVTVNRLISNGPGKYVMFTEFDPSEVSEGKVLTDDAASPHNVSAERLPDTSDWMKFANLLNSCVFIVTVIVYIVLISNYIPTD